MTGKTLGWGDAQELPPAFCIFIFVHLLLFTFWGGKGEPPPSLFPRSTEGRGAREVGASSPPTPSCLSPSCPLPFQGLCIIVSE